MDPGRGIQTKEIATETIKAGASGYPGVPFDMGGGRA